MRLPCPLGRFFAQATAIPLLGRQEARIRIHLRRASARRTMPRMSTPPPVTLARWGSFHVGGRMVELSGQAIREYLPTVGGAPVEPAA